MTFYHLVRAVLLGAGRILFGVRAFGVEHVPTSGAYIVAPTHRSVFDVPFASIVTRRRIRFMAKRELFSTTFGKRLFDALGAISVDRASTDRAALRACQAALEAGEPVAIFPEGTRRRGPELGPLFDGAAYLALKLGVPIVPVAVGGSEEILASGRVFPRLHRVRVVVGPPVVASAVEGPIRRSAVAEVSAELRTTLQACFDEARALAAG